MQTSKFSDSVLENLIAEKHQDALEGLKQTEAQHRHWLGALEDTIANIEDSAHRYEQTGVLKWYNPIVARRDPSSLAEQLKVNAKFARIPPGRVSSVSADASHRLWRSMQEEPLASRMRYGNPSSNPHRSPSQSMAHSNQLPRPIYGTGSQHGSNSSRTQCTIDKIRLLSEQRLKGHLEDTLRCELHPGIPKQKSRWLSASVLNQCESEIETLSRPAYIIPFDPYPARRSFISCGSTSSMAPPGDALDARELTSSPASPEAHTKRQSSPRRVTGLRSIGVQAQVTNSTERDMKQQEVERINSKVDPSASVRNDLNSDRMNVSNLCSNKNHSEIEKNHASSSETYNRHIESVVTPPNGRQAQVTPQTATTSSISRRHEDVSSDVHGVDLKHLSSVGAESRSRLLATYPSNTLSQDTQGVLSADGKSQFHGSEGLLSTGSHQEQVFETSMASIVSNPLKQDELDESNSAIGGNRYLWLPMEESKVPEFQDTTTTDTGMETIYTDIENFAQELENREASASIPNPSKQLQKQGRHPVSDAQDMRNIQPMRTTATSPSTITPERTATTGGNASPSSVGLETPKLSGATNTWKTGLTTIHLSPSGSMEIVLDGAESHDVLYDSQGRDSDTLKSEGLPPRSSEADFSLEEIERLHLQLSTTEGDVGQQASKRDSFIGEHASISKVKSTNNSSSSSQFGEAIGDQNLGQLAALVEEQHEALVRLGIL